MTGTQKLIGWALFALVIVVLVIASTSDRDHPEGYSGSYLGRTVANATDGADAELNGRAATQRF
jgi:hypothetical protein